MVDEIEQITGIKGKVDVVAVTLKLAGGFDKCKTIKAPVNPSWLSNVVKRKGKSFKTKFRRHHTKNAVNLTYELVLMKLKDDSWILCSSTNPKLSVKHSSANVYEFEGVEYNIPDNAKNVYVIETTYEFTCDNSKKPMHRYFIDKTSWPSGVYCDLLDEYLSLYEDDRFHSTIKSTTVYELTK